MPTISQELNFSSDQNFVMKHFAELDAKNDIHYEIYLIGLNSRIFFQINLSKKNFLSLNI